MFKSLQPNSNPGLFGFWTDFWLTSGISIIVISLLLVFCLPSSFTFTTPNNLISVTLLFQLFINWPHFMVSYRLLYSQPHVFKRHKSAAIVVPLMLLGIVATIFFLSKGDEKQLGWSLLLGYIFWLIASFYLAWHYVGQAWGCFITFSLLVNHDWDNQKKLILYWSFRSLIAWHLVWAAQLLPDISLFAWLQSDLLYYGVATTAVVGCLASGSVVIMAWRAKQIDIRSLGIWFSIYFWYLAIFFDNKFILWVQLAHALQYLVFAARVELNHASLADNTIISKKTRTLFIYFCATFLGWLIFWQAELSTSLGSATPTIIGLVAIAINIHHYYVDSNIWKLRSNSTKRKLFSHIH
jgi:hypothetical protein